MEDSKNAVVKELMRLLPHAEIQHHIPGRIRLKILPSGFGVALSMDPESLEHVVPGIRNVRANIMARSVIIEYDHRKIPMEFWENLRKLRDSPEKAQEMEQQLLALWD